MSKLIAFPYLGGKQRQAKWIISLLPTDCDHYVEPFCGGASVFLNKPPSPLETINDISGDVINFFVVLRNDYDEFIHRLRYTAYARDEHQLANLPTNDSVERARRFYVRVRQSILCLSSTWKYASGRSKKGTVNYPNIFINQIEKLNLVVARLKQVQIENRPAIDIIKRVDHPGTVVYCDPPYLHSTRSPHREYKEHEMSEDDHVELANLLLNCKAKVAISGYESSLYDKLYSQWQQHKKEFCCYSSGSTGNRYRRIECLWTNYQVK